MCRAHPDGGRRCPKNKTGLALDALRQLLRKHPTRERELSDRITKLCDARSLYGPVVTPFEMDLDPGVHAAMDIARRAGNPLIVGGAVRDATLGADPKDIDIEVYGANIDTLTQRFLDEGYTVDEVGKQFGVLKVSKKGVVSDLDVAVPRRENKVGAGHRGFAVDVDSSGTMTVAEAAARRDFTVNAILYDHLCRAMVDPYDGSADLKAGVLRHVSEKFSEDPLRVLRGVQMAGRFNMTLDPDTASLCRDLRPQFATLATERVQEEWAKLYVKSTKPEMAVRALQETGWDDIIPGLKAALADDRTVKFLSRLPKVAPEERIVVGSAMVSSTMSPSDRSGFLAQTVLGKDSQNIAEDLASTDPARLNTSYERKVHANDMSRRGFTFERYLKFCGLRGDLAGIRVARAALAEGIATQPEPPMIQGRDVIALVGKSRKPGPWVGELVAEALDRQYRGEFTDVDAAREWLGDACVAKLPS
jgi:tRNA nucleotidyltransferase/poly(A) polymerase